MVQHSKHLRWNLFAARDSSGIRNFTESPSTFKPGTTIVRARVTVDTHGTWIGRLDTTGGAPSDLRLYIPGADTVAGEVMRFRIAIGATAEATPRRVPGDPAARSLRWTVHPGALTDRTCQMVAAGDPYATAETAWYLASSPDGFVRATVAQNKASPAALLEWMASNDTPNAVFAQRTLGRIRASIPRLERARLAADELLIVDNLNTPTAVLDGLARFGTTAVRTRAMTNPATPVSAVATTLRNGELGARVIAARRFASIEGNPRWSGFSRRAIVAAVEWDLDDDEADVARDMDETELADNFGAWADMPLSRR